MVKFTAACVYEQVGNFIVEKVVGVRMGDSLSSMKASATFDHHEWCATKIQQERSAPPGLNWLESSEEVREVIGGLRYADDSVIASRVFCTKCLREYGGWVYKRPIIFEHEEDTDANGTISFVDTTIHTFQNGSHSIKRTEKNEEFIHGRAREQTRVRYAPCLGGRITYEELKKISAWISATWHVETRTQDAEWSAYGATAVIAELSILGYSKQTLRKAVGSIQHVGLRSTRNYVQRWISRVWAEHGKAPWEACDAEAVKSEMHRWWMRITYRQFLQNQ